MENSPMCGYGMEDSGTSQVGGQKYLLFTRLSFNKTDTICGKMYIFAIALGNK